MKIAVGSENPTKTEATRLAFEKLFPEEKIEIIEVKTSSGVSKQPIGDEETSQGARNRANQALKMPQADFGVGIEGGMEKIGANRFSIGWVVILDRQKREGIGSGPKTLLPPKIADMIEQGMELGDADDIVFGKTNSKQAEGFIGIMTNNSITRTEGMKIGVITALARFLHPEVF